MGADSTSFMCGWIHNGYPFGHDSVIFSPFSIYLAVIISVCTKIVIGSGKSGVAPSPITLVTQKLVEVNCCKSLI